MSSDPKRAMLRHTVATLAYRGAKVIREMPAACAGFCPGEGCRTPIEILTHINDLLDWALSIAESRGEWKPSKPSSWDAESERFFAGLKAFDDCLASENPCRHRSRSCFKGPWRMRSPMSDNWQFCEEWPERPSEERATSLLISTPEELAVINPPPNASSS